MFTKPAGCFIQLLGAVAVIVGILMLASGYWALGSVAVTLVGVALLWRGRQMRALK
jgi:hypothetical protein